MRIASWERPFDLEALRGGGLWLADHLQACFERLGLDDVVETTEIQAPFCRGRGSGV